MPAIDLYVDGAGSRKVMINKIACNKYLRAFSEKFDRIIVNSEVGGDKAYNGQAKDKKDDQGFCIFQTKLTDGSGKIV